jgi:hypothetical protein
MKLEFLGQFNFAAFQPTFPSRSDLPFRLPLQAQATRFQAPVTSVISDVYVSVFVARPAGRVNTPPRPAGSPYYYDFQNFNLPPSPAAQGWVKRANFDALVRWLGSHNNFSLHIRGENYGVTVTRTQLPEVVRLLGLLYSPATVFGIDEGTLGQDESIPGISIECEKCELWEKQAGSVATGCACEPDPLRIGAAALVVGGLIWYLMK